MTVAPLLLDAVTIRRAGIEDAEALLELQQVGFGSEWTMADWRHRYADNLTGGPEIVGAFTRSGSCVAAFCGVLMPCKFHGKVQLACRGGDVAVHPDLRQTAAGPKLLLRVCKAFVEGLVGRDVGVIFGFPQPGLLRTLVRHCRYEAMADVLWLTKSVDTALHPPRDDATTISRELPGDAAAFLQECTDDQDAGVIRDMRYLRWRYLDEPRGSYLVVTHRSRAGAMTGMAIVRQDEAEPGVLLVNEWLVRRGDSATPHALLDGIESVAAELGRTNLVTSLSSSHPSFALLQHEHGFRVAPAPHQFTVRPFARNITRAYLFENWFHTLGDLDFT